MGLMWSFYGIDMGLICFFLWDLAALNPGSYGIIDGTNGD
jgi:hypothetical protein